MGNAILKTDPTEAVTNCNWFAASSSRHRARHVGLGPVGWEGDPDLGVSNSRHARSG
jgi:hypothetical protein